MVGNCNDKGKDEMEDFIYIFFPKKDLRKIKLFSLLKSAPNQRIHINELEKSFSCSRKTLYSDLKELEQDLISVYKISILKKENNEFSLVYVEKAQSQQLLHYYVKKSKDFWIFHMISKNKKISYSSLSNSLHYSQTSIFKSAVKLNKKFKPLGISCLASGLIGDEKKIRHLLFESYWTLFGGIEWPFKMKRECFLSEVKKLEQLGLNISDLEKEKVLYWLAITSLRLSNGKSLFSMKVQVDNGISKKLLFNTFFLKYCGKYKKETNFEEENRFLIYTISLIGNLSLELKLIRDQTKQIKNIENYLRLKGTEAHLNRNEMNLLELDLNKINYYVKENLIDWYQFIEPEAKRYSRENSILMEEKWSVLQDNLCEGLSDMYVHIAKKNGIYLVDPIRMYISSKESRIAEFGQLLKKHSAYPIEISQSLESKLDIVLTNYLMENQNNLLLSDIFFYEWPITETQINNIVTVAIKRKKEKRMVNI